MSRLARQGHGSSQEITVTANDVTMACPFCGLAEIAYGLALCAGCHADIRYDVAERNGVDAGEEWRLNALLARGEAAERWFDRAPFPFNWFAKRQMELWGSCRNRCYAASVWSRPWRGKVFWKRRARR